METNPKIKGKKDDLTNNKVCVFSSLRPYWRSEKIKRFFLWEKDPFLQYANIFYCLTPLTWLPCKHSDKSARFVVMGSKQRFSYSALVCQ